MAPRLKIFVKPPVKKQPKPPPTSTSPYGPGLRHDGADSSPKKLSVSAVLNPAPGRSPAPSHPRSEATMQSAVSGECMSPMDGYGQIIAERRKNADRRSAAVGLLLSHQPSPSPSRAGQPFDRAALVTEHARILARIDEHAGRFQRFHLDNTVSDRIAKECFLDLLDECENIDDDVRAWKRLSNGVNEVEGAESAEMRSLLVSLQRATSDLTFRASDAGTRLREWYGKPALGGASSRQPSALPQLAGLHVVEQPSEVGIKEDLIRLGGAYIDLMSKIRSQAPSVKSVDENIKAFAELKQRKRKLDGDVIRLPELGVEIDPQWYLELNAWDARLRELEELLMRADEPNTLQSGRANSAQDTNDRSSPRTHDIGPRDDAASSLPGVIDVAQSGERPRSPKGKGRAVDMELSMPKLNRSRPWNRSRADAPSPASDAPSVGSRASARESVGSDDDHELSPELFDSDNASVGSDDIPDTDNDDAILSESLRVERGRKKSRLLRPLLPAISSERSAAKGFLLPGIESFGPFLGPASDVMGAASSSKSTGMTYAQDDTLWYTQEDVEMQRMLEQQFETVKQQKTAEAEAERQTPKRAALVPPMPGRATSEGSE